MVPQLALAIVKASATVNDRSIERCRRDAVIAGGTGRNIAQASPRGLYRSWQRYAIGTARPLTRLWNQVFASGFPRRVGSACFPEPHALRGSDWGALLIKVRSCSCVPPLPPVCIG